MTLNIVVQYYADLSFNANFRQSFRRFWRWMPDRVGHDEERWPVGACSICRNDYFIHEFLRKSSYICCTRL